MSKSNKYGKLAGKATISTTIITANFISGFIDGFKSKLPELKQTVGNIFPTTEEEEITE